MKNLFVMFALFGSLALLFQGCKADQSNNSADTEAIVMNINGMTWGTAWGNKVKAALDKLPGVKKVEVDFDAKKVTVTGEKGKVDKSKLADAVNKADPKFKATLQ